MGRNAWLVGGLLAAAMVVAFVGLALVRNHFAAVGEREPAGVAAS